MTERYGFEVSAWVEPKYYNALRANVDAAIQKAVDAERERIAKMLDPHSATIAFWIRSNQIERPSHSPIQYDCVIIYGLIDPRDPDVICYVGRTTRLASRLSGHRNSAGKKRVLPVDNWTHNLKAQGVRVQMRILEVAPEEGWEGVEQKWITHYRKLGPLLNVEDGGVNQWGQKPEETYRKSMTEAARIARRLRADGKKVRADILERSVAIICAERDELLKSHLVNSDTIKKFDDEIGTIVLYGAS